MLFKGDWEDYWLDLYHVVVSLKILSLSIVLKSPSWPRTSNFGFMSGLWIELDWLMDSNFECGSLLPFLMGALGTEVDGWFSRNCTMCLRVMSRTGLDHGFKFWVWQLATNSYGIRALGTEVDGWFLRNCTMCLGKDSTFEISSPNHSHIHLITLHIHLILYIHFKTLILLTHPPKNFQYT